MPYALPSDTPAPVTGITGPGKQPPVVTTRPSPRQVTNPPAPGYAWPTPGTRLTSNFGAHHGIDIDGSSGDPVVAPAAGQVIFAGDASDSGYGGLVIIQDSAGAKHYLAHLRRIDVQEGATINPGDFLGEMGGDPTDPMQGNSTGSHLHYEVRVGTAQVNPLQFFGGTAGQYGSIQIAPPPSGQSYTGPGAAGPSSPGYIPGTPHDTSGSQPAPGVPHDTSGSEPPEDRPGIQLPKFSTPLGEIDLGEIPLPEIDWGRIVIGAVGVGLIIVGVLALTGEEAISAAAGKLAKPIAEAIEGAS